MSEDDRQELLAAMAIALERLTPSQLALVRSVIAQLQLKTAVYRAADSDFISESGLNHICDALLAHHAMSRQPLSKDRFEYALEGALMKAGHAVEMAPRGNPGYDIMVDGARVSLKTQADKHIKADTLHISKFMELGKGVWELAILRNRFLAHLQKYDRVFSFRCFRQGATGYLYELVEIPKALLLEAANAKLVVQEDTRQNPKPGYGYVYASDGSQKYALYFDAGSERKLQVKHLRKDLCKLHATWSFDSTSPT